MMGIESLERAAEARGRILKVERQTPPDTASDPLRAVMLVLTFDVGRVRVGFEPAQLRLEVELLQDASSLPPQLEDLAEEDPWWRVLGNVLARVTPSEGKGDLVECVLQFREDDENPRRIGLRAEPGGLRVLPEVAAG